MPCKRKRADSELPGQPAVLQSNQNLRSSENSACRRITHQGSMRDATDVNEPMRRIRTDDEAGRSTPSRPWITAIRWWPVTPRFVFLDGMPNQRAGGSASRGPNGRSTHSTSGRATDNRSGARAVSGARAGGRITGIQSERKKRHQRNSWQTILFHNDPLESNPRN
jgi:hypothetical protein